MKTTATLLASLFASLLSAQVPQLWGLTTSGGANDKGTIFHVNGDGSGFATVFSFDSLSGASPEGGLCVANGKLYGMALLYGAHGAGTLYSYDPSGAGFHKILDFDMTDGGLPWGSMIKATDGMLYGATYMGGGSGGSIFRLDPGTDTYTRLHVLDQATDGGSVTDRLMEASDGALYGVGAYGGANNEGCIFRYVPSTDSYTKLHDFDNTNGATPYGTLCQGTDGLLYGMTYEGGSDNSGVLFSIDPVTGAFLKRLDFTGPNGQSPWGSLVRASDGTLYGTTTLGGPSTGSIFSFDPATNTLTTLHSFSGLDGGLLFGSAIIGSDGNIYGMGATGGDTFEGNVYRFNTSDNTVTPIHSCSSPDGISPRGELVESGTVTAITEQAAAPQFTVFPNPSDGDLTIVLDPTDVPDATVRLLNGVGQVVRTEQLTRTRTPLRTGLAAGAYTLVIETRNGRATRSIVVR